MGENRMPNLSDEAKRKKAAYDTSYVLAHITQKRINFNDQIPEDVEMLSWVNKQPNQGQYLKGLIREDMQKAGK